MTDDTTPTPTTTDEAPAAASAEPTRKRKRKRSSSGDPKAAAKRKDCLWCVHEAPDLRVVSEGGYGYVRVACPDCGRHWHAPTAPASLVVGVCREAEAERAQRSHVCPECGGLARWAGKCECSREV